VSVLDEADAARGRIVLVSDLQGTLADARITVPALVALDIRAIPGGAGNIAVLAAQRTGDGVVATVRNDSRSTRQVRLRPKPRSICRRCSPWTFDCTRR
jgi:hypothetical protein